MNWFLGRGGGTLVLVLSCVLTVLGAGVALWRDAPAPIGETRPLQEAPVGRPREGDAAGRHRDEAAVARPVVTVSPSRRIHILDGDRTGGGHRPGQGLPGKSEFPAGWSDDRIIEAIESVANDPAAFRRVEADGRTVVSGRRDGVDLRVVVERDGRSVVTGYPTNTPRNPQR